MDILQKQVVPWETLGVIANELVSSSYMTTKVTKINTEKGKETKKTIGCEFLFVICQISEEINLIRWYGVA